MKYIIKSILVIIMSSLISLNVYGQSYMRYQMRDGAFNGFYTNCVDSISHSIEDGISVQKVFIGNTIKTIPVKDIVDISFESATLDSNENYGEYRLYDLDLGDQEFKRVLIDNRSFCMASKNGDFGANDSIFVASVYNNVKAIIYTDSQGRVSRYFDGENYFILDYKVDGTVDLIDIAKGDHITITNRVFHETRGSLSLTWIKRLDVFAVELTEYFIGKDVSVALEMIQICSNILSNIDSNPELHNQRVILGWLTIAGDLVGLGSSLFAVAPSGGLTLPIIALQLADLYFDCQSLKEEMYPDSDAKDKYKDYYASKYGINVVTLPAVDIKSTSATLKGLLGCGDGVKGDLHFVISEVKGDGYNYVTPNYDEAATNQFKVEAKVTDLTPGTRYKYYLEYQCKVDGLTFRYQKEAKNFTTVKPTAVTGKANVTDNSAVIECEYKNAEGMWCGLQYAYSRADGVKGEGVITVGSDGKQSITIPDLVPCATYTYRAVISYGEESYVGESKTFTANPPDISGVWSCTVTSYTATGQPKYETYDITLNKDGSVLCDDVMQILKSSWYLSKTGEVRISIIIISRKDYDQGQVWQGKIDDFDNPKKITGSTYYWNATTVGYYQGDGRHIEMTR